MEFNKPYEIWAKTRLEAMMLLEQKGIWPRKAPFSLFMTRNLATEDAEGRILFTITFKHEAPTGPPILRDVYTRKL